MAKNEQKIKFEAEVKGFKANIKEAEKSITTLNKQLKLNQAQLEGNSKDTNLLKDKIETLTSKYQEQGKKVENYKAIIKSLSEEYEKQHKKTDELRTKYEETAQSMGENSKEAKDLADKLIIQEDREKQLKNAINDTNNKLVTAQTEEQKVKNEIEQANRQLDAQTNWFKNTGKAVEESGKRLQEYGKKIESVGNKLSIVSGAVGGIAVASLKSSIDFESAFTGVTKTVDGTEEQLAGLRKEILELSTKLPSSASEIAKVAESAGQLGIATEDIMSFTKVMIDLGNSTNVSADEASTSLAKFANITKMSAKDYDKLGSTIVELGNNFATTEADIIAMGQNLASAGTQVGMSQSDIMALATALSSVGLEAQAGGTAFSKALIEMQLAVETNSKDLKNWADVAGMSVNEFSDLFKKDATSALEAFIKGLSECGGETDSAIKVLNDMGITETRLRDSLLRSANASTTFSKAIKTGSKAWKENTALTKEASKRYGTTESQLKMLKNEVQKTAVEFGDELAPSLRQIVKDAKPMLNTISSAVKSFSNLDSQTKQTILKLGALAVAGGPVIKMGGSLITTLGKTKEGIGTFVGALGVLKNGEEGASEGAVKMASSLKGIASPAGLTTLAIGALAVGYGIYSAKMEEATKAEREEAQAIEDSMNVTKEKVKALEDERNSIDASMTSKVKELNYNKSLFDELKTIVDENGKVKDGYLDRAKVITSQLSDALGIEIGLNGDVIEGYQKLQEEIDLTILKKKAEAKYEASQEKANKARANQDSLIAQMTEKQEKLNELTKKYDQMTSNAYSSAANGIVGTLRQITSLGKDEGELKRTSKEIENLKNEINTLSNELESEAGIIREADKTTELWVSNTKEGYQELANSTSTYVEVNGELRKQDLTNLIKTAQFKIEQEKKALDEYKKNNDSTMIGITESNKAEYEKQLVDYGNQLIALTSTTERNSPEVINAWKQMAQSESDIYKQILSNCAPEQKKAIQAMVDGTNEYSPKLQEASSKMMMATLFRLKQDPLFRKTALDNMQGFLNGLNDSQLRETLEYAGVSDVNKVMQGIREGNLAKAEGEKILSALNRGLQDGSLTSSLFKTARGLSSRLSSMFSIKAKVDTSSIPGHKSGLDYVPYDNYIARLHKGERVLTAQENRDYIAENKVSNRSLVVQFYPQKMDDSELKRAENYISRKWGLNL